MRYGVVAVMLALMPAGAMAERAMAVCVQAQLAISGFSPGVIDGLIGPATQEAVKGLRASTPDFDALPDLTVATSYDWCRAFGQRDPRLQQFWPVAVREKLRLDAALAPEQRDAAMQAYEMARIYFFEEYDRDLVGDMPFIVAPDAGAALKAAGDIRRNKGAELGAELAGFDCADGAGLQSAVLRDMAVFCMGQMEEQGAGRIDDVFMRSFVRAFAGALMHDLSGLNQRRALPSSEIAAGPAWLTMGATGVFEADFATQILQEDAPEPEKLAQALAGLDRPLSEYRTGEAGPVEAFEAAVYLLAERFGRDKLFDFFDAQREADSLTGAFQNVFGVPLDAFEAEVDALSSDPDAVSRFQQGA
jgi:hypothetical protein